MSTIEQHKKILIVDDDRDVRDILGTVLRGRGLVVDVASDGNEALSRIAETTYSVVLLDLLMPTIDGFAVLRTLRDSKEAHPVVLVLTGADRSVVDTLDPKSIHGVIRKPFEPEEVASVVAACADIKGRMPFETMAIATLVAGSPFLALLERFSG